LQLLLDNRAFSFFYTFCGQNPQIPETRRTASEGQTRRNGACLLQLLLQRI
jgi:hypothetical protein